MQLIDEADGEAAEWRFTVVDGISAREALTMQFAENFHQSKPEPVQFARAARLIMAEDPSLTAAEVSRIVGAPAVVDAQVAAAARAAGGDRRARRARRPVVHRRRLRAPRVARGRRDRRARPRSSWRQHADGGATRHGAQVRRRLRPAAAGELRRRSPPGWTPPGARPPKPRRARSATRTTRPSTAPSAVRAAAHADGAAAQRRRARRLRARRVPAPLRDRRARASCCGSRARPTRTSTPARCTRTSGSRRCARSRGKRSRRPRGSSSTK